MPATVTTRRVLHLWLILALLGVAPRGALAHRYTRAQLTIDLGKGDELQVVLRGRRRAFTPIVSAALGNRVPTAAVYRARSQRLLWAAATHISIYDANRRLCNVLRRRLDLDVGAAEVSITLRYRCPPALAAGAPLELRYDLLFATDPDHKVFVTIRGARQRKKATLSTLDQSQRTIRFSRRSTSGATLWRFFRLGNHHIFEGIDHILFLLALLLVAPLRARREGRGLRGGLLHLLGIVSTFTVAHSLTLGACAMGWLTLPSRLVESAIAASIVWVAAENVLWPTSKLRLPLVFAFGLLHGFGFAHVLGETGLPPGQLVGALLAFNVGVEASQLLIVALAFPLLWLVDRSLAARLGDRAQRFFLWPASAALLVVGAYWFVTRLLGA